MQSFDDFSQVLEIVFRCTDFYLSIRHVSLKEKQFSYFWHCDINSEKYRNRKKEQGNGGSTVQDVLDEAAFDSNRGLGSFQTTLLQPK